MCLCISMPAFWMVVPIKKESFSFFSCLSFISFFLCVLSPGRIVQRLKLTDLMELLIYILVLYEQSILWINSRQSSDVVRSFLFFFLFFCYFDLVETCHHFHKNLQQFIHQRDKIPNTELLIIYPILLPMPKNFMWCIKYRDGHHKSQPLIKYCIHLPECLTKILWSKEPWNSFVKLSFFPLLPTSGEIVWKYCDRNILKYFTSTPFFKDCHNNAKQL